MKMLSFMFSMLHILEKKEKKKFIVCLLLIFLPIFVANITPLPKK